MLLEDSSFNFLTNKKERASSGERQPKSPMLLQLDIEHNVPWKQAQGQASEAEE